MKKVLHIMVLVDALTIPDADPEFKEKPETTNMEYNVVRALRQLGHEVKILGISDQIAPLVESLNHSHPDLVFNLVEVFRDERRFDANIAGLLELAGVAFTGTGSTGLMICRNKGLCKQVLSTRKIRVPGYHVFPIGHKIKLTKSLHLPLVVKPLFADGSEGISNASLVKTDKELVERVSWVHEQMHQPAIAEEYIEGREFYIGVLGNGKLSVLPPYELFFGKEEDGGPVMATYRVKWNKKYQDKWNIRFGLTEVEENVHKNISRVCRKVFKLLQLQDYARIDLRLTPENKVVILEANPNPDISDGEEIAEAAKKIGISYKLLIERIIEMALARHRNQNTV